jgi:small subunit ribosomal protein S16
MLIIRLSRVGRKNDPSFRIVLQEKHRAPTGKVIEFLGFYNARLKQKSFKEERIKYWIGKGAQASDTAHNLLVSAKIINQPKRKATNVSKKKKEKEQKSAEPKEKKEIEKEENIKNEELEKEPKKEGAEKDKKEEFDKPKKEQIVKKDNASEKKETKEEKSKMAK